MTETNPNAIAPPAFISQQVKQGDYFFLNLNPDPKSDLVVVCGGSEHCLASYQIDREKFSYYGIEFVAGGECLLSLDHREYHLKPGAIFCYGPNTPLQITSTGEEELVKFFVDLKGTRVADLLWSTFFENPRPYQIAQYRWIHDIFRHILDSGKKGGPHVQKICGLLIELLIERIHQLSVVPDEAHSQAYATYERCRSYLNNHFAELENINDLAMACNVSSPYLARLFKRFAQTSPSNLLTQNKMNRAAELLMNGRLLIKEVAAQVGFEDPYYFSRAFKKFFGVSPKGFIESLKRG